MKRCDSGVLKQIRLAAQADVNIDFYVQEGYDEYQLNEIRLPLYALC